MEQYSFKDILAILSAVAFIVYGVICIFSGHMIEEFERYGLIKFRKFVGFLELLGGLGLLIGLKYHWILLASSLGLATLMFLGVLVRIWIKDRFILIIPAFLLLIVNLSIFLASLL